MAVSTSPEIHPCHAVSRPQVLALLSSCGLPEAGLADHWDNTWVAAGSAEPSLVLGCVALERNGNAALLRSLAIRSDCRSQGLGSALFDFAMARAADLDLEAVVLLTTTAAPFFAKRGFIPISREAAPASLMGSAEFLGACPASAQTMIRLLR